MVKRKYINGEYIELTAEEIAAMQAESERMAEEMKNLPPSMEDRMEAIESAFLALLGGGL